MDTRLATRQVRMSQWAEVIRDRNESGLTIREYCAQHGISRDAYFYWLRKIRESAIEASGGQFAELTAPAEPVITGAGTAGVIIEMGGAKIRVENTGCRDTLTMVLEVLKNAQ